MKEKLKRVKLDLILSAVICVALGVVLLFWPAETIDIFCKVLAVGLIIMGGMQLLSYFADRLNNPFSGIIGAVILLVGLWVFLSPQSVVSLIPIVIGVVLVIHGIQDIKMALEAKSNGYGNWGVMMIIAIVGVALGALCIVNAFGLVTLATQIIGIALIYDGLTDLWIIFKTLVAVHRAMQEEQALESEYKEVEE
jgi:uncharacterized membrane protein HdeD (DUF308 family)